MFYYVDWSCLWNPWMWWWAFIAENWLSKYWQSEWITTNNEMELQAIFQACIHCKENWFHKQSKISIHSDSMRSVNVINWVWKLKAIEYFPLVAEISSMIDEMNIDLLWVKWHNKNEYNEIVDRKAKLWARWC